MSRGKPALAVVPTLTDAQLAGLDGARKQLDKAYMLVRATIAMLRHIRTDGEGKILEQIYSFELDHPLMLLAMAEDEMSDLKHLNRIERGS